MKTEFKFFIFIGLFLLVSLSFLSSQQVFVQSFKQEVTFNISQNFYVDTLIELNPEIESISYLEDGETIGYLNVLGGVGENFIVYSNVTYEVVLSENVSIKLPY